MPAFRFSAVCRGAQGSVARAQRRIQRLETPIPALVRSQQHRVVAYATHGDCQASSISGSFTPAINAGRVDRSVRCARSENGLPNFVFRFSMKYASEPEVRKQASALSGPIASFSKLDSPGIERPGAQGTIVHQPIAHAPSHSHPPLQQECSLAVDSIVPKDLRNLPRDGNFVH